MDTGSTTEQSLVTFDARLKVPFTCIVAGAPLSGKTRFVQRLLEERSRLIDHTFDEVVWFYGQETDFVRRIDDRLYTLPIRTVRGLPDDFEDYMDPNKKLLFVIDDLMQNAVDSTAVTDLFCNKVQHAKVSVILLIQNLFYHGRERTTLVRCAHYLTVFRNPMDNSIPLYLAQKLMPLNKALFMRMFDEATSKPHGYLFCDGKQDTPNQARFRTDLFDGGIQRAYVIDKYASTSKKTCLGCTQTASAIKEAGNTTLKSSDSSTQGVPDAVVQGQEQ